MIQELIKYFYLEEKEKQLYRKIPYTFLIFFAINLFVKIKSELDIYTALGLFFLGYFITTSQLNNRLERILNSITGINLEKPLQRISEVYAGRRSLIKDFQNFEDSEKGVFLGFYILAGISLFAIQLIFFYILFARVFDKTIEPIFAIGAIIYVIQDLQKPDFYEEPKKEKPPFILDFFELYIIDNSLKESKINRTGLYLIYRLFSPMIQINMPQHYFKTLLVYDNNELENFFKKIIKKDLESDEQPESKKEEMILKRVEGLEDIFGESVPTDKTYSLIEDPPIKNFPYLFGEDAKGKPYTVFKVVLSSNKREVGQIILHLFRGLSIRRRMKRTMGGSREPHMKYWVEPMNVLHIILSGDRKYLKYFEIQIRLRSTKMPHGFMDAELLQPGES